MKNLQIVIVLVLLFLTPHANTQVMTNFETDFIVGSVNNGIQYVPGVSTIYKSSNGNVFPPTGSFRTLTIFVNIIYDQTPTADPESAFSTIWQPNTTSNPININPPTYLSNLFDIEEQLTYNGLVSRLYAESSFNNLILLTDYMVVNIKQSQITPDTPGASIGKSQLMDAVISLININGGLNTIYGHNNSSEYDKLSMSYAGLVKPIAQDTKIDFISFLLRNTTETYGGLPRGYGNAGIFPSQKLLIGSQSFGYNACTYQCIGNDDITLIKKNIFIHEIAHLFLGGNSFHTSGSDANNDYSFYRTFIGKQYGYGLFAGGLTTCNGYERWRLGWQNNTNNAFPIATNNQNSDINSKFLGEQVFILRDFVTSGDAIRIKLPYKDSSNSSNQYIWIENHQSGKNNKMDGFNYSNPATCRDVDLAGIYCYYQVGKDILESSTNSDVFPTNEKDNLRIISAEGNYNASFLGFTEDCLNFCGTGIACRPKFEFISQNVFHGVSSQNEAINPDLTKLTLDYVTTHKYFGSVVKNGVSIKNLPYLGEKYDAFLPTTNGVAMDISSNPSAINTTTFYSVQTTSITPMDDYRNTKKIYLSGLSVKMIDSDPTNLGMKAYTVKIRWDDYDVKQDVNWTGDIVLKEQLNLLSGKKIILEQNMTPCQISKNPVSGVFAPTTFFTCEGNSVFNMADNSSVLLKEKSSLVLNSNSTLTVQNGGIITIESGSTLQIKAGATVNLVGSAKIVIKSGGYICVESGANINLQNYNSLIVLEEGAVIGANPLLFSYPSCASTITKSINSLGVIVDFNQDIYIQDVTISTSRYYGGKNIFVGNHVTTSQTAGDVLINNGANVIFDCKNIVFDPGFECSFGSTYEVKNH